MSSFVQNRSPHLQMGVSDDVHPVSALKRAKERFARAVLSPAESGLTLSNYP